MTRWEKRLQGDNATPLAVLGVRHAPAPAGQLVVVTVDEPEMTDQVLAGFFRKAAIMLDPTQRRAIYD